jgi:predicted nucleotidyltransferase
MAEPHTLDLSQHDLEIVLAILRAHISERPVFVFGSRVTGKARRRSDLDIAVGGGPMSMGLCADLAEAFDESDLPITVDVVELATASETFRRRIERDWLPLSHENKSADKKELVSA